VLFRVLVGAVVDSGVPIAEGSREFPSEFRDLREQCALRLRAEQNYFLVVGKKELPADEESGRLLQETEYEGTGKIWAVLRLLQRQGLGWDFFYRRKTEQQRHGGIFSIAEKKNSRRDFFYRWKTEQQRKKIIAAGRRGFRVVVAGDRI
jgi:hypothetical protein